MAKSLDKLALFVSGDPEAATPTQAFFTYRVVDGAAVKKSQSHAINEPNWTQSAEDFWDAGVTEIKTKEGIV